MPVNYQNRAETVNALHALQEPSFKGGYSGRIILFCIAWLSTFNKAVVNGDDINHMQGHYGNELLLPHFSSDWIPNRVVDLYGRNLLAHMFDLVFFPAHILFGADFFFVFKIFNATLFATFLCIVHRYLYLRISAATPNQSSMLRSLFVAFLVLVILPWTNEVRAVCYEIPAFITFVVLAELLDCIFGLAKTGCTKAPSPWLLVLGYIAAFSLEGYTAIMLTALLFASGLTWQWDQVRKHQVAVIVASLVGFCVLAIFITIVFSQRIHIGAGTSLLVEVLQFLRHRQNFPEDALIFSLPLVTGLAGAGTLWFLRHRLANLTPATVSFTIITCATLIVVGLISLQADQNYFSFTSYPWGGMLLIAMFSAVPAVTIPLADFQQDRLISNSIRIFLMIIALSWMAIFVMNTTQQNYERSCLVLNAYRAVGHYTGQVFDTGLSLDQIPMQERPLPTAASPAWFIRGYEAFFLKYYGVDSHIIFK
ncbi:hypothetical protein [Acidocella sp.]|uniref:hypothetical protein n=1 Tax=Acidocella sp. TaxID=50710 RepID=UPI00260F38C1|nr:hypothetical protein [Acidocella sp.]